jgi:hypothetical protein
VDVGVLDGPDERPRGVDDGVGVDAEHCVQRLGDGSDRPDH